MSDVDETETPETSATASLRNLPAAIPARLRQMNPMRTSGPPASPSGGILADRATDDLDDLAVAVFDQLRELPEEYFLTQPHQAVMDLAAHMAASLNYQAPADPSAAQLQAIVHELPATTRRVLSAHVSGSNFRQIAQELAIPSEVALRELKRAYAHLLMRLPSTASSG